ncbi:hypothetical protein TRVL_00932 [Trypanosoma vivax]|nr:hypothetical protein TRVL_00932 [Trypanosoma vivax]
MCDPSHLCIQATGERGTGSARRKDTPLGDTSPPSPALPGSVRKREGARLAAAQREEHLVELLQRASQVFKGKRAYSTALMQRNVDLRHFRSVVRSMETNQRGSVRGAKQPLSQFKQLGSERLIEMGMETGPLEEAADYVNRTDCRGDGHKSASAGACHHALRRRERKITFSDQLKRPASPTNVHNVPFVNGSTYTASMTARLRRAMAPPPPKEQLGEVIHAMVGEIVRDARRRGVDLQMIRQSPCVYTCVYRIARKSGSKTASRVLNLSIDSARLTVRSGGGNVNIFEFLERNCNYSPA